MSGQSSFAYLIMSGVPQGRILGPTLFLLYTNDAEDQQPAGAQPAAYADDTTLYKCISTNTAVPEDVTTLQLAVNALADWGMAWHIRFEPTKSQSLLISHHRNTVVVPPIVFQGTVVLEVDQLKLLGVLFDQHLSFTAHIRQLAIRGSQRLGFLRKASRVLDSRCRGVIYKGFVGPVLEYGMLVWMSAAPTTLARLTAIQRRGLHLIGNGAYLPSLDIRRMVGALHFLYKLHFSTDPDMLLTLLPPRATNTSRHSRRTQKHPSHQFQLTSTLPPRVRNDVLWSFPDAVVEVWNQLPQCVLLNQPTRKRLQTFKEKVNAHLRLTRWEWATDRL